MNNNIEVNKCKNCKYFGERVDTHSSIKEEFHICNYFRHCDDYIRSEEDYDPGKPHCIDGSDYYAAVRVPEDFGCNGFEVMEVNT
jgi:hypothetical protein